MRDYNWGLVLFIIGAGLVIIGAVTGADIARQNTFMASIVATQCPVQDVTVDGQCMTGLMIWNAAVHSNCAALHPVNVTTCSGVADALPCYEQDCSLYVGSVAYPSGSLYFAAIAAVIMGTALAAFGSFMICSAYRE